ncbi:MAG: cytochrome c [Acidimicrobiia bacterium]|nr:cytochrome c [Acidimicrobiia bacterium]
MKHMLVIATALFVAVSGGALTLARAQAPAKKTVWDGAYTKEQADRGASAFAANCTNCHGPNLEGTGRFKALVGNTFWNDFSSRSVQYVLNYISKNMPNGVNAGTLDPSTYIDLMAFILSRNDLPTGTTPLTAQNAADFEIIPKDGPRALADKTLARVVGCLAKAGSGWVVNNATAPERADAGAAPADLGTRALGDRSFQLLFVLTRLDRMAGHRVAVRGLLVGEDGSGGINVTEVTDAGATCP